jgi:hypothetical protein
MNYGKKYPVPGTPLTITKSGKAFGARSTPLTVSSSKAVAYWKDGRGRSISIARAMNRAFGTPVQSWKKLGQVTELAVKHVQHLEDHAPKQTVRDAILSCSPDNPTALTFPGTQAIFELALPKHSDITCLEKNKSIAAIVRHKLPTNARLIVQDAARFFKKPDKQFNLLWLDTMCDWTAEQGELLGSMFMHHVLAPKDAVLAVTVIDQQRVPQPMDVNSDNVRRAVAGLAYAYGYEVTPLKEVEYKTVGGQAAIVSIFRVNKTGNSSTWDLKPLNRVIISSF